MKKKLGFYAKICNIFYFNSTNVSYFFFGVGVTMFLLNLIGIVHAIKMVATFGAIVYIPTLGYYVSTLSSIFLMTYSFYNLFEGK